MGAQCSSEAGFSAAFEHLCEGDPEILVHDARSKSAARQHPKRSPLSGANEPTTRTLAGSFIDESYPGIETVDVVDAHGVFWGGDDGQGQGPLCEPWETPSHCPMPSPVASPRGALDEVHDGEGHFKLPRKLSKETIAEASPDGHETKSSCKGRVVDSHRTAVGASADPSLSPREQEAADAGISTREPSTDDGVGDTRGVAVAEVECVGADDVLAPGDGGTYFDRERGELAGLKRECPGVQEDRPLHTFRSGATYLGQWRENVRHGFGVQRWPDGASYEGQWKDDRAHGQGRFKYCDGDASYTGQWRHNRANGVGTAVHNDRTYHGEWRDDFQSGVGVEVWQDGSRFDGEFVHGAKHGVGLYRWSDGSRHSGTWKDGMMSGRGEFRGADGRVLHGTWAEHRKNGIGKCTWESGEKYAGQYVNDVKEGFGDFWWPDGTLKRCFWRGGMPTDVMD